MTGECDGRGCDPDEFKGGRETAITQLEDEIQNDRHPEGKRRAYWTLKNLRNALAHGNRPRIERYRRMLKEPKTLATELESSLKRLLG